MLRRSPANHTTLPGPAASGDARRYLIFQLDSEEYGIALLRIREIIRMRPPAPIPHSPDYLAGVINLRGKIVPVVDLRVRFGLAPAPSFERRCIIVVDALGPAGAVAAGIVVDDVVEVADLGAGDIERAPDFGERARHPEITGIAKTQSGLRILLDPDEVLHIKSWAGLDAVGAA